MVSKKPVDMLGALLDGKILRDSSGAEWQRMEDGTLRYRKNGVWLGVNDSAYCLEAFIRWVDKADVQVVEEEGFEW